MVQAAEYQALGVILRIKIIQIHVYQFCKISNVVELHPMTRYMMVALSLFLIGCGQDEVQKPADPNVVFADQFFWRRAGGSFPRELFKPARECARPKLIAAAASISSDDKKFILSWDDWEQIPSEQQRATAGDLHKIFNDCALPLVRDAYFSPN